MSEAKKGIKSLNFEAIYWRVCISGNTDRIPCRVAHKIASKRKQKKNVLRTGFTVTPVGKDNYVGFTVDGDNRYLLDDFTITHNCGKTIVMAKVAEEQQRLHPDKQILVLAHRGELLNQAMNKFEKATALTTVKEKAQETSIGSEAQVVVASVQTMKNDKRLHQFDPEQFSTIMVDETHHIMAKMYRKVIDYFPNANMLGVTATADRTDKLDLGEVFDSVAYEYDLATAIKDGYLSPLTAQTIPINIDLNGVHMKAGDFNESELDDVLGPYLERIADEMVLACEGRQTVVFMPLIATSKRFVDILNKKGFRAAEVNGQSKNRDTILKDFENRKYEVLVNAILLTEGWDCPTVDCIVMLRPTKSRSLYAQCIGRGTRLSQGKKECLILDFLWNSSKHALCHPVSLLTKNEALVHNASLLAQNGEPKAVDELVEEAKEEYKKAQYAQLTRELEALSIRRRRKKLDPFEIFLGNANGVDFSDETQKMTMSQNQKNWLDSNNIDTSLIKTYAQAESLINQLTHREPDQATLKQVKLLKDKGFKQADQWTKVEASEVIGKIAENFWEVPRSIHPNTYQPKRLENIENKENSSSIQHSEIKERIKKFDKLIEKQFLELIASDKEVTANDKLRKAMLQAMMEEKSNRVTAIKRAFLQKKSQKEIDGIVYQENKEFYTQTKEAWKVSEEKLRQEKRREARKKERVKKEQKQKEKIISREKAEEVSKAREDKIKELFPDEWYLVKALNGRWMKKYKGRITAIALTKREGDYYVRVHISDFNKKTFKERKKKQIIDHFYGFSSEVHFRGEKHLSIPISTLKEFFYKETVVAAIL
ncbi:hypothetical protein D7I46_01300 [Lactococcus allomyrinae]|uniref:DEAD/DEAH box helicase n=2 Tax=Lactococcus allomyrinae TaxID=2419773 RepID=A0A387BI75_9LACT|nr:hypothetical protein D7I46_01300 [Lactococcus allomyrinae]